MSSPQSRPLPPSLSPARLERLKRVRSLSRILDNSITLPGLNYRIGLDPIIGLLPGGGDLLTGLMSVYILVEAYRLGIPTATLGRMAFNILLEVVAGTIPTIGDLFDVVWKANARNVTLIEQHLQQPQSTRRPNQFFFVIIVALLIAAIIGVAAFAILVVQFVWRALVGG
ncbi:MAG: DUF4112 domain-containing protein [Leptolyngbya sp. SIO4C5]|uniref:DUF4112 domain-containing protein n=1 Tax=Sphaerothrix gracilis TaxID=3151835 RepID=UPI0013C2098B|nr:DUF4112 domain-containing protein [Leptolyngbya sp. SIO4C5]